MKRVTISGSPYAIGEQLGLAGRDAWQQVILPSPLGQTVTGLQDSPAARRMGELTREYFPDIWQEILGMAAGLDAPVATVFAWQCRGDLVRSTSDGCTTVAGFGGEGEWYIAHNEDGTPELGPWCRIVDIRPEGGCAFTSFAYPASICGHTFAVNQYGIVNTVNNIRALERPEGLPRQVLARASLNARTLAEARDILTTLPRSGAFHHTLGQQGHRQILSIEACGQRQSVIGITDRSGHANHLIHPTMAQQEQVITASSGQRQERLMGWQSTSRTPLNGADILSILSDRHNSQLPIYRLDPEDPDGENTLATVIFTLTERGVSWAVYGADRQEPLIICE